MKTIYLVRHGFTHNPDQVFYPPDAPLDPVGVKELHALGTEMKHAGCKPTRIISSPYLRARESAEILSLELGVPHVEFDERLVEWQVDGWIGKKLADFRHHVGYDHEPFTPDTNGIEDFPSMAARVRGAISDAAETTPDEACTVLVSHREPMVAAILTLQSKGFEDVPKLPFGKASAWRLRFDGTAFVDAVPAFDCSSPESKTLV
ncbi:MAG TPA: histidine phosphatase family protein [Verrucomicrobiae bacterium]|nr:histidine phosphatase family protein [Verrucomicrobiae bacterium]